MIDVDTFLTTLYVMVDDFYKEQFYSPPSPGRPTSLTVSEVVTLSIFSQWYFFRSQRDFYCWAERHLKGAFPKLPDRAEYNRMERKQYEVLVSFFLYLCQFLDTQDSPFEILDTSGVPVRNVKRRGKGWLAGMANIGWCTRVGWFFGFRLLTSINREGLITGYGFAQGSAKEQPMSDTFIHLRHHPDPHLASVGQPARGRVYLADQGFAAQKMHAHWREQYGIQMICEPQTNRSPWPRPWREWLHHLRQIVETTFHKLIDFFRLEKNRSHDLMGFQVSLAAKIALYNFCIWLNKQQFGRPPLAFSDLLDW
jgi:hypothetical protein